MDNGITFAQVMAILEEKRKATQGRYWYPDSDSQIESCNERAAEVDAQLEVLADLTREIEQANKLIVCQAALDASPYVTGEVETVAVRYLTPAEKGFTTDDDLQRMSKKAYRRKRKPTNASSYTGS